MTTMPLSTVLLLSQSTGTSWECHKCHHTNHDRKRCGQCMAWKGGITPLTASRAKKNETNSAAAIVVCNESSLSLPTDENANPNIASSSSSSYHVPTKRDINARRRPEDSNTNNALQPTPTWSSSLPSTQSSSALPLPPPSQSLLPNQPTVLPLPFIAQEVCRGVYNGFFGQALIFAAKTLQYTAKQLMEWASEPDFGMSSFRASGLAQSSTFCLPHFGMIMDRAPDPMDGYVFRAETCSGICTAGGSKKHCDVCKSSKGINLATEIKRLPLRPNNKRAGERSSIHNIANNPNLAEIEIRALRDEVKQLKREAAVRAILDAELAKHGSEVPNTSSGK